MTPHIARIQRQENKTAYERFIMEGFNNNLGYVPAS